MRLQKVSKDSVELMSKKKLALKEQARVQIANGFPLLWGRIKDLEAPTLFVFPKIFWAIEI